MQKHKKSVEIQGQTPRKLEQQQMISFFSMVYGTEKCCSINNIICLNR